MPKRAKRRRVRRKPSTALRKLPSLAQVCESPDQFLGRLDIAALNLMCAGGLPHANIKVGRIFDWLDEAARKVDFDTRRHWYRFIDSPATYNNSPGYFCCYHLLQALQEDFGVRYNPARVKDPKFQDPKCIDPDFTDSRDLFIHGIIDGPGGTCASMPVLYVAVGRRLGYPLKLVEARGHLYCRWDDPEGKRLGVPERFNIEGAGHGIASYPDEHYETWPEPWTDAERAGGFYGKSLTPSQELAAFLCTRAECLTDNGRTAEAIQAYRWATGLVPDDRRYRAQLHRLDGTTAAAMHALMRPYEEQRRRHWLMQQQLEMPAVMRDWNSVGHGARAGPQSFPNLPAGIPNPRAFPSLPQPIVPRLLNSSTPAAERGG